MNQVVKVELALQPETAEALSDRRRMAAIEHLVDRMVRPATNDDPLAALLEATTARAQESELTDEAVHAELAVYNAERRQG